MVRDYGRQYQNRKAVTQEIAEGMDPLKRAPNPEYEKYPFKTEPAERYVFPIWRLKEVINNLRGFHDDMEDSGMLSDESLEVISECFYKLWNIKEVQDSLKDLSR